MDIPMTNGTMYVVMRFDQVTYLYSDTGSVSGDFEENRSAGGLPEPPGELVGLDGP